MKALVTGAAGFVGSHFVDRLLKDGAEVVGVDNLSTGRREFLAGALRSPRFRLVQKDLLEPASLAGALTPDVEWVFHFAANADVREGLTFPRRDLEQNTLATWNVLDAMRREGVRNIVFSSTGSVYGEAQVIPTPEGCPFPVQTSLYGASKLAAEGLISAFCEGYGLRGRIFRFVSIMGERYTHGHVLDFLKKLKQDPERLQVLGDGKQKKSYLYIGDCVEAIFCAIRRPSPKPTEIYNLGTDEYVDVDQSIDLICEELGLRPRREYGGGDRGWIGDNPFIFLDCARIRSLGWKPRVSIRESIRLTLRYLLENPWIWGKGADA